MERRERYDPEDLEHLLLERSYDELLEEERAFVLRHLSGRAEYESMRALLHTVRHEERDHAIIDADPAVRERVLETFRMQRRPRWDIWLNSVKAALWPDHAKAFWKPALTLASVAVVVLVTWIGVRRWNEVPTNAVAEVHHEVVRPEEPKKEERAPVLDVPPAAPPASTQQDADQPQRAETYTREASNEQQAAPPVEAPAVAEATPELEEAEKKLPATADLREQQWSTTTGAASAGDTAFQPTLDAAHVVTADELATNLSLSNATGAVAKEVIVSANRKRTEGRTEKAKSGDAASTDATALVGLLRAAW